MNVSGQVAISLTLGGKTFAYLDQQRLAPDKTEVRSRRFAPAALDANKVELHQSIYIPGLSQQEHLLHHQVHLLGRHSAGRRPKLRRVKPDSIIL
jgi:hypothetical protein